MMIELKGYGLHLGVLAFKGLAISEVKAFLRSISEMVGGVEFQVLNLKYVAGLRHIITSVLISLEAFKHGLNIADKLSMEILVRASGQRQIGKALKILGVKEGSQDLVLVLIDKDRSRVEKAITKLKEAYEAHVDEGALEADRSQHIMEAYELSEEEVKAEEAYARSMWDSVKNLVAERVILSLIS